MNYDGGKNGAGVWQLIISQMPPHKHYVELFLGSGAIMRRKRPAPGQNIGVEIDPATVAAVKPLLSPVHQIIEADALAWLRHSVVLPETLIYADPPYLMETRSCQRDLYRHEFGSQADHIELLHELNATAAAVIISGYASSLYARMLPAPKWRRIDFTAGSRGGPRTESLWLNFPAGAELHDYRFIGDGKTDRQRVRRKIERWKNRLAKMAPQERGAILTAIQELSGS